MKRSTKTMRFMNSAASRHHRIGVWLMIGAMGACGDDSGNVSGTDGTSSETSGDPDTATMTGPDPDSSTNPDPDSSTSPDPDTSTGPEESSSTGEPPVLLPAEFLVRIENISGDSALPSTISAGVWVEQAPASTPIFTLDVPDFGDGLVPLAEDGDPTTLAAAAGSIGNVLQAGTWDAPIAPGESVEFTLTAENGSRLSLFGGLGQANDSFVATGPVGVSLFTNAGLPEDERDISSVLRVYDVGSEFNQAPGQGSQQLSSQSAAGVGMAESGQVVAFASSTRALPQAAALLGSSCQSAGRTRSCPHPGRRTRSPPSRWRGGFARP